MKKNVKKNKHMGSSFDSFLKEAGIFEEVDAAAREHIRMVRAKGLDEYLKTRLSKEEIAEIEKEAEKEVALLLRRHNKKS